MPASVSRALAGVPEISLEAFLGLCSQLAERSERAQS